MKPYPEVIAVNGGQWLIFLSILRGPLVLLRAPPLPLSASPYLFPRYFSAPAFLATFLPIGQPPPLRAGWDFLPWTRCWLGSAPSPFRHVFADVSHGVMPSQWVVCFSPGRPGRGLRSLELLSLALCPASCPCPRHLPPAFSFPHPLGLPALPSGLGPLDFFRWGRMWLPLPLVSCRCPFWLDS